MAMLITRFHKLIQSKVVWYIILGVVVITFVGFFTPTIGTGDRAQKAPPAGELFGEKISRDDYYSARRNAYLWYILSSGQMVKMTDELNVALGQAAWKRIAVLRKAEERNISVTDKEVLAQIQTMPLFRSENGAFDIQIYRQVLQALELSERDFENLLREQVLIARMTSDSVQAALVSPSEVDELYHRYTDRFILDYVLIPYEQAEKGVTVSKEEAKIFFAENSEKFRIGNKVRVSYVEFAVSDFLDQAELPEDAAQQFYDKNTERFRIETTNENSVTEYKPFDQVKDEINEQLRMDAARRLATEKATEFVAEVAPKAEGVQPNFAGAAAAAKLTIKTLPAFGKTDPLNGIDSTAPFRQAAFGLEDDVYSSFSDAVAGKDTVYVLSLEQRYPSFVPEFDAVEQEVTKEARRQAVIKVLAERASEIQTAVAKAGETGTGFREAVAPFNLPVQTTPEFDMSTELDDKNAAALMRHCVDLKQGQLCELTPVENGVLLACVASRKNAEAGAESSELRKELSDYLSRSRSQNLADEWQTSLLTEGNFKDLMSGPSE